MGSWVNCQLTVLFEAPFWVGLLERRDERGYAVARVIFGGEPSDVEVYNFMLRDYGTVPYSDPITDPVPVRQETNFKRRQREARQMVATTRPNTKAQEALRLELEKNKQARQEISKAERDELAERKFRLRLEKRKQKKAGH